MSNANAKSAEVLIDGRYELLREVKGFAGDGLILIGTPGHCRYCGTCDTALFRKIAHTFPEALGNKWVISQDECDGCNTKIFSLYDEELAKAVSPFLTLGGVKGKDNKIRQTGRTGRGSVITQSRGVEGRSLLFVLNDTDPAGLLGVDPRNGMMQMRTPIAAVPFKPRHAYKALAKMGVALLPDDELPHYTKLIEWLDDPTDDEDFPVLEVGMSFGSIGNAPPLAYGALLKRTNPHDIIPHIVFLFAAGSVCCQIDLMSDHLEDHIPPVPRGSINIRHSVVIGDESSAGMSVRIPYGHQVHLNWSSNAVAPQPIEAMIFDFNPVTYEGGFTPEFRAQWSENE